MMTFTLGDESSAPCPAMYDRAKSGLNQSEGVGVHRGWANLCHGLSLQTV